ncbi:DUF1217 domain-containing protein [Rhizobium mongolense]|uniref:DUF1217 domain-containing protein n=1 Tax=Rhizobium TaxID=379 RepID=UPI0024B27996|nr:DUF1217 domain-containing protein [Rhizobium sp. CC1099]WFU88061.1 DUF1217 domain-containing protein [Rhizobium sp. CC1099]
MISASVAYAIISRDPKTSLDRIASQATVKRDAEYYAENINKVKDVDDFLGNYKLYSYAMKAYGLDDMTYAKAFMKKVLESDLTDPDSFANKLSDQRYKQFAAAFNFNAPKPDAQTDAQEDDLIDRYSASFTDQEKQAIKDTDYYSAEIADVQTVDDLVNNTRLRTYVLKTFGIDTTYASKQFLRDVLTSDLNDPNSVVNLQGGEKYQALAAQFNFNADGTVNGSAQTATQKNTVMEQYNLNSSTVIVDNDVFPDIVYTTKAAADYNKAYYESKIKTITNVDSLIADERLTDYIKAAYSLGPSSFGTDLSDTALRQILVDPAYANTMGATAVHQAFSFEADGSVLGPDGPQSDSLIQATSVNYMARYDDEAKAAIEEIVANYKTRMSDTRTLDNFSDVDSINDFLKTNKTGDLDKTNDDLPDLYQVALQAYGLTEEELSKSVMRRLLASDPYDPEGYVASFKDDRITQLARAFNFDGEGNASIQLQALSPAAMAKYATNYKSHVTMLMKDGPLKEKASKDATEEVDYFAKTMESVQSLDDFLEDDRLTGLILKSVGLDPKDYDEETLRKIFTSDPDDANSYLNTKADSKFKNLVADFNFDTAGNLTRAKLGIVQDQGALDRTQDAYLQQTLETQEGETNDGTRLALYFARKAPDITSLYSILGDKALFQVITTAYNLPSQISSMDVEKQVALLEKFVDLKDLGDSKKVDKLVKRFTAMYDIQNVTTQSPALQILTGGG